MTRPALLLTLLLCVVLTPTGLRAGADLGTAMALAREAKWSDAVQRARRDGPVATDVIEWMRLRAAEGAAAEVRAFLDRRPDWPGEALLRARSEAAILRAGDEAILDFFAELPPQTSAGVLAYAGALTRAGKDSAAEANLILAWRTMPIPKNVESAFLERHAELLAPHHEARLDAMLWEGARDDAERMLPRVRDDLGLLARARLALQRLDPGVDARIEAVPEALKDEPGLAYDRFRWRLRKGRPESAQELLLSRTASAERLGRPEAWARARGNLVRAEMREGDARTAYRIASEHHLIEGSDFAELEWLAGYIALRKLGDPGRALEHFKAFDAAVFTPISKGRAGYWLGRAHEALGDVLAADMAYAAGAEHQTSFYGLLAAERAGLPPDPELSGDEQFPDWRDSKLAKRDLFIAGLLLIEAGEIDLAERFWTHLAESLDRTEAGQLGQAAIDLGRPHLAVRIGKRLAQYGHTLPGPYYPLHPIGAAELPMAPEMTLAIARRESEFDPAARSGAGARGLMQIMPATGKLVAAKLKIESQHKTERLTTDPGYNARLGATYLAMLADRFDGNVVLMSVGYNAGPGRAVRWQETNGDPRQMTSDFEIVDWIEHIPFNETRNYVMRVTESLPVYRARLGLAPHPLPFSKELSGTTLKKYASDLN